MFEIEKTLIVSTAHLTYQDSLSLEHHANNPCEVTSLIVDKTFGGWIVSVPTDADEFKHTLENAVFCTYSTYFPRILYLAYNLGVNNIKFDRDGKVYDCLQSFSWEEK